MTRLLFAPLRTFAGLLAGFIGKKAFERLWRVFDDEQAPSPEHRAVPWYKLLAALALEGAVFRAVRGLADHGARRAFKTLTGRWPGEEHPERARDAHAKAS
jgi:hypothetical protein